MTTLQQAIEFARDAKVADFKGVINDILADKVQDHLAIAKMRVANKIFNNTEESDTSDDEFRTDAEDKVDEDL
jgi:hypothetical protein